MTNPVTQNAGQMPSPATPFFNPDGKTLTTPWRAFFRTLGAITGSSGGGGPDLVTLIAALRNNVDGIMAEVLMAGAPVQRPADPHIDLIALPWPVAADPGAPVHAQRLYPRTAGTAGQVLVSSGPLQEPSWGAALKSSAAPVAVTLTGSPFTYTAPSSGALVIAGGTVSAVQFKRTTTAALPIAGQFVLATGDQIVITYTVAPTVTFIPF